MFRRHFAALAVALASLLLLAACGGDDGGDETAAQEETSAETVTGGGDTIGAEIDAPFGFDLEPIGDSGASGQVTVTPSGASETDVEVVLDDTDGGPHPAHIHEGTCDDLNPEPAIPLADVENGTSATTVDMGAADLLDGEFAVNVHASADDLETYIACGELPSRDEVIQGS